jgi:hypothetical protein
MANLWLRCQSRNAQGSKVIIGLVGNIRCLWPPPGYYGPGPGYDVPHRDMAAPVLATAALAPDMPAPVLETALAPDMPAPVLETPALAPILTMAACHAIALISTTILPALGSATNSPDPFQFSAISAPLSLRMLSKIRGRLASGYSHRLIGSCRLTQSCSAFMFSVTILGGRR